MLISWHDRKPPSGPTRGGRWANPVWGKRDGQSLVEMALLLPVLLLLIMGTLDLGRAYSAYMMLQNSAREGARFAAANPLDNTGINVRARREAQTSGYSLTSVTPSCPNGIGTCTQGNPIKVTVTYNFRPIVTGIVGLNVVYMAASCQFMVI